MSAQREWGPGDVAAIRWKDYPEERAFYWDGLWRDVDGATFVGTERDLSIRPLVVIDPEDRKQVARLASAWYDLLDDGETLHGRMRAALRSLNEPPKPDEPTDPNAFVADRRENIWRQLVGGDWVCTNGPDIGEYLTWSRLADERGPLSIEVIP